MFCTIHTDARNSYRVGRTRLELRLTMQPGIRGTLLSTGFVKAPMRRRPPNSARRGTSRSRRPRVVLMDADREFAELLVEIFEDDYEVVTRPRPTTLAEIDVNGADVVIIGTVDPQSRAAVARDEIVARIRRHVGERTVPIVILSCGPNVLGEAEGLAGIGGVTVVMLPFDLDTIESVLESVAPRAKRLNWASGRSPA